ncbi:MAG: hypothetical protein ACRC6V_05435 [Bacteroidales bacterium]
MAKLMSVGPFTFDHTEFCNWHQGRYKQIRTQGTEESNSFLVKLNLAPSELFFHNGTDVTCNHTLSSLIMTVKPAPENDIRTTDKLSIKARAGKLSITDDVYTVVPVSNIQGRSGLFQETGHLHIAFYCAIIDGVIEVDDGVEGFIPTHWTVKVSRNTPTVPDFVSKINSHDNKADMVTNIQFNRMQMAASNLENYSIHKLAKGGATLAKDLTGNASILGLFSCEVCGPLFKAYLDSTREDKNHFNALQRAFEQVVAAVPDFPKPKSEHTQGGFTIGFLSRMKQYVLEEDLVLEDAVTLIRDKMSATVSLGPRELAPLMNSVRLMYNLQTVDVTFGSSHVAMRHKQLGKAFAVACFNHR